MAETQESSLSKSLSGLKVFAEIAVLITLSASFLSIFANYLLFDALGIDFSYVVNPADIIIGGVQVLQNCSLTLFSIFSSVLILYNIGWKDVEIFGDVFLRFLWLFSSFILILASLPAFGGIAIDSTAYLNYYVPSFVFVPFVVIFLVTSFFLQKRKYRVRVVRIQAFTIIFLSIMTSLISSGVNGRTLVVLNDNSGRCKVLEYVVWAGSSSLLTTCSQPPHVRGKSYFLVKRDAQVLKISSRGVGEL